MNKQTNHCPLAETVSSDVKTTLQQQQQQHLFKHDKNSAKADVVVYGQ